MRYKFAGMGYDAISEELTNSSGISVSLLSDSSNSLHLPIEDRLRFVALQNDYDNRSSVHDVHQQTAIYRDNILRLPKIEQKRTEKDFLNNMKSENFVSPLSKQLPRLPALSLAVPPTVGKYRQPLKVIPIVNLPSPDPLKPPSPPPAAHLFLRDQFIKERNQASPGFTQEDFDRIFDHYSLARYLTTEESRSANTRKSPHCDKVHTNIKHLPAVKDVKYMANNYNMRDKSSKLVWIPKLSSWVSQSQYIDGRLLQSNQLVGIRIKRRNVSLVFIFLNSGDCVDNEKILKDLIDMEKRPIQYLKFGSVANINERPLPICCQCHDIYHHNLNWNVRNCDPTTCPRYLFHHHHVTPKEKNVVDSKSNLLNKKRKPLTIARDPFKSKSQREIKRPWLKEVKPIKEVITKPVPDADQLVLPDEKEDPYLWMIDNATMTDDSSSDVFSIPYSRHSVTFSPDCFKPNQPIRIRKKSKVVMLDQGCDVASFSPMSLQRSRSHTAASVTQDDLEEPFEFTEASVYETFREKDTVIEEPSSLISPRLVPSSTVKEILMENKEEYESDHKQHTNDEIKSNFVQREAEDVETLETQQRTFENQTEDAIIDAFVEKASEFQSDITSTVEGSIDAVENFDDVYFPVTTNQFNGNILNLSTRSSSPELDNKSKTRQKPPLPRFVSIPVEKKKEKTNISVSDDNASDKTTTSSIKRLPVIIPQPTMDRRGSSRSCRSDCSFGTMLTPTQSKKSARRRRKVVRDTTVSDEIKRERLAEERKKKAKEKFDRLKELRTIAPSPFYLPSETPETEEADTFLEKYCILNSAKMDAYKRVFALVDSDEDGYLNCSEVQEAMQKILPNLSLQESDFNHIYKLLELVNYDMIKEKIDFKLFAIMTSLAQKLHSLDDFMRGIIDRFDFQSLDSKMWKARRFFDHLIDDAEKRVMSLECLWVELKAGGVTQKHENQIRKSLEHLPHIDVLDFMTYLPLFALTHSHMIGDPLREDRVI